jgi:hypothetical protein
MLASGLTLYRLDTPVAIGAALQEMFLQKSVLSLYANPDADDALVLSPEAKPLGMASLAAVDTQASTCALTVSAPLLPWPVHTLAVAHMAGGVRVQCVVPGDWQQAEGKHWQLEMPWPAHMLQLQRRRHPRFHVPLGQHYSASFMFGRKRCELDINDLSTAGLALRGSRAETAMLFIGRALPRVSLYMADGSVLEVALKVRSRRSYQSFLLGEQVLVGCSIETIAEGDQQTLETWLASGAQPLHA